MFQSKIFNKKNNRYEIYDNRRIESSVSSLFLSMLNVDLTENHKKVVQNQLQLRALKETSIEPSSDFFFEGEEWNKSFLIYPQRRAIQGS